MVSRWFIFWMSLFIIYSVKGNDDIALLFLLFAIFSGDPIEHIKNMWNDMKDKKNG